MVVFWTLTTAAVVVLPHAAQASRFHVQVGGTRTSGASVPGVWTLENCYPTLLLGVLAAGPVDTVLLAKQEHQLGSLVSLRAFLANRDLDEQRDSCHVRLSTNATLRVESASTGAVVRGITFAPGEPATTLPALRILPPATPGTEVIVEGCAFTGLTGRYGTNVGGAAVHAVASAAARLSLVLRRTLFTDCVSLGRGAAVCGGDGIDLTVAECTFERNEAQSPTGSVFAGAIAVVSSTVRSSVTIERSHLRENRSWGPGGAIYVQDGHLTMRDTEVRDSRSAYTAVTNWSAGAGVFVRRVTSDPEPVELIVERCRIIGNRGDLSGGTAAGDGGGMMIRGSDTDSPVAVTISDCLFADNFNDQGAGLYVGRGASGTITRSWFLNNTAHSNGGGAYKGGQLASNLGETALFSYCVFAGNRAGWDQNDQPVAYYGWGGGFMTRLNPRAEFHNCTFADNLSGPNVHLGDAFYHWGEWQPFPDERQRCRLVNCLFYGTAGNDVQVRSDAYGFTEVANCAWEPGQFVCEGVTPTGTVELAGSPFVGPDDWRLVPGSACIEAAVPLGYTVDIDSTRVPRGLAPDIGAYEFIFPVGVPDDPTGPPTNGGLGLRLHPASPNPANPRALVSFTLATPGDVSLTVHDLAGRRVAVLAEGPFTAGDHAARWDGRDAAGAAVSSGLYCVRLAAAGRVASQKLMLVR